MSTDLAIRDRLARQVVTLDNEQLRYISNTEFVPKGLRGNLPAILACVAAGRSIGVDDMSALRNIHIVDGRPAFSAELMVMLVRRAGHSITGSVGDGQATIKGRRKDNGDTMEVTWTMAMAQRAGLAEKKNWKQYPEAMLWARAASQLCRELFADCFMGGTYTAEELGDEYEHGAAAIDDDSGIHPADRVDLADYEISHPPGEGSEGEPSAIDKAADSASVGHASAAGAKPASPSDNTYEQRGPGDPAAVISDAQLRRMWAIWRETGLPDQILKDLVGRVAGVESTKAIPKDKYDALVAAIEETTSVPF